jgi:hypothetical protein
MGYLSSPVGSQVFSRSWPSPMKRIKSVGSGVAVSHTVGFALGSLPSGPAFSETPQLLNSSKLLVIISSVADPCRGSSESPACA